MEDKPATPDNDSSIEDTNSRDELIADKFVELEECKQNYCCVTN
jgi:hypothetical protein